MAENDDSQSDMDFIADMLNCDVDQLRPIDDTLVQQEAERIDPFSADNSHELKCKKCGVRFLHMKSLKRHLRNNTCSKQQFICQNCGKVYEKLAYLTRHTELGKCVRPRQNAVASECSESLTCSKCKTSFSKRSNLTRHLKKASCRSLQKTSIFECQRCKKTFSSAGTLKLHSRTHNPEPSVPNNNQPIHASDDPNATGIDENGGGDDSQDNEEDNADDNGEDHVDDGDDGKVQSRESMFQDSLVRYTLRAEGAEQQDLMFFFSNRRSQLRNNLLRELRRFKQLKWYVVVKLDMVRYNSDGEQVDEGTPTFRSFTRQVLDHGVIDSQIDEAFFKMTNSLDSFRAEGSGWMIRKVINMKQTITKFSPLGGSCFNYPMPQPLLRKRCLLNVTGPPELDGHCFKYAVLAGLFTNENVIGSMPWSDLHQYRDALNFDGVESSGRYMPVTSITAFENNNNVSINVYGYEEEQVFPIYVTKQLIQQRHVNLLLLCPKHDENDADEENEIENFQTIADHRRAHYCVIKNMSGLVSAQVTRRESRVFICNRCLSVKHSAESLREHELLCSQEEEEPVRCFMPGQEEKWVRFRNIGKRMKASFVIVACFSCYTVPLLANDVETHGYEVRERRLDPCAYSYMRISIDNSYPKEVVYYRGTSPSDTMEHFLSAMASEEEEVFKILSQTAPVVWCDEGLANVEASNESCIWCNDPFLPGDKICLDHSHVSVSCFIYLSMLKIMLFRRCTVFI